MRFFSALLAVAGMTTAFAPSAMAAPPLHGIAIEERLDEPEQMPATGVSADLPLVVVLVVDEQALRGPAAADVMTRLDARVASYRAKKIPVVLRLGALPSSDTDIQAWTTAVRMLADRERGKIAAYQVGAVTADALPEARLYAFVLKQAAVQIRSADADAFIVQGDVPATAAEWQRQLYAEGIAPYVDAVSVSTPASIDPLADIVTREDPTAAIWLAAKTLPAANSAAAEELVRTALQWVGTKVRLTAFRGQPAVVRAALTSLARIADVLAGDVVTLDQAPVRWFRGDRDVTKGVSARLLYGQSSGDSYLVVDDGLEAGRVDVEVGVNSTAPALRDPFGPAVERLGIPAKRDGRTRIELRAPAHPFVIDLNYGVAATSAVSEVRGTAMPGVDEIIARHQQVQAAQDALLKTYIAHLRIEQHFHPNPAEPAYNIVTENTLFADAAGNDKEWQELSFSINGATWTSNRPSFPLLQPEKVLSLPLDLRLTQEYRYRLAGVESVDGRPAFVVRFDPIETAHALYRGTLWIDIETFTRVKVVAVQTPGSGPVSANEETQFFTRAGEIDGKAIWLLTRLDSKQTLLVAGRTILNERQIHLTDIHLNPSDFDTVRAEARGSAELMYKDTDAGVRYFVKKGGTRVVSDSVTASARAFALGADIDPSFDYPLPIAGIDILDFDFLHRDMQLALLFGGVIGVGNIQRAGLLHGHLDMSVDFFGLAVKSNDSVFDAAGELRGERVRTLPASVGLVGGYRLSASHKLTGRVDLRYDAYSRDVNTAADFVMPSSTATIGEGIGYEYRHHGYSLLANASTSRRTTWTAWGREPFDASTRSYVKYDVGLTKDFVFRTFHTIHLNGQYFGGERLDRFSMYAFGMFDATRMHGVPSAVRFGELAMLRASYSFNLFNQYRLDLFADHARGRATGSSDWQPVTGVGFSVNLRGPRSTMLRADIGRSFLPETYRGAGSTVVQIMILKPL